MCRHDGPRDEQAKADAARRTFRRAASQRFEDDGDDARRNRRTTVVHGARHRVAGVFQYSTAGACEGAPSSGRQWLNAKLSGQMVRPGRRREDPMMSRVAGTAAALASVFFYAVSAANGQTPAEASR